LLAARYAVPMPFSSNFPRLSAQDMLFIVVYSFIDSNELLLGFGGRSL
jgi:hypothetical protein